MKQQENIVFLDANTLGADINIKPLETFGNLTVIPDCKIEDIANAIQEATIVITNKKSLGKRELEHAKRVSLICECATGYNNIDIAYCKQHNITVCNISGYATNGVAQHTFALLLDLFDKNTYYHSYITSGAYSANPLFTHFENTFYELSDKRWGIVGMGAIGQKVANIATAFGAHVQYFSTSGKNKQQPYPCVDFDTLLTTSDIISIHAPLNEQTENLFTTKQFVKMKKSAYIINVGRGKIIHEASLAKALMEDQIAGAGLDVFSQEPLEKESPLLQVPADKLRMSPHIAWATKEARERIVQELVLNIQAYKAGEARNHCY